MSRRNKSESSLEYNPKWLDRVCGYCTVVVKQNKDDRGLASFGVTTDERKVLLEEGIEEKHFRTHSKFPGFLLPTGDVSSKAHDILKRKKFSKTDHVVIVENE